MKIEFDIDLSELDKPIPKDGQITVKLPKAEEEKFLVLNQKYKKRLSIYMRTLALKLIAAIEEREAS